MWHGTLLQIHTCPAARAPMQPQTTARLLAGEGIEGDRYALNTGTYSPFPDIREVTLIEVETLLALARDHRIDLAPHEHRRNLTTEGVPLNHLVGRRFRVGSVLLEGGREIPEGILDAVVTTAIAKQDLKNKRNSFASPALALPNAWFFSTPCSNN